MLNLTDHLPLLEDDNQTTFLTETDFEINDNLLPEVSTLWKAGVMIVLRNSFTPYFDLVVNIPTEKKNHAEGQSEYKVLASIYIMQGNWIDELEKAIQNLAADADVTELI